MRLNNKIVYYFDSRYFTLQGEEWEIIGSWKNPTDNRIEAMIHKCRRIIDNVDRNVVMEKLTKLLITEKNNKLAELSKI